MSVVEGSSIMLIPPARAWPWDTAHSLPALAATKEEEQAVSMATAGPFNPKWYEIRPERKQSMSPVRRENDVTALRHYDVI